jgi:gluconate 2-dehydrogenase gamma chain
MDRRTFLLATGGALPLYAASALATFTAAEAALVESLCAQIIPADDLPGAREAGVLYYIDRQLSGPLKRFAPAYHSNLPALADYSRTQQGREFQELSPTEQKELLLRLESSGSPELKSFFQMIIDHTMQGFYGSPAHGGNRDEASWKMLGITDVMEGHQH